MFPLNLIHIFVELCLNMLTRRWRPHFGINFCISRVWYSEALTSLLEYIIRKLQSIDGWRLHPSSCPHAHKRVQTHTHTHHMLRLFLSLFLPTERTRERWWKMYMQSPPLNLSVCQNLILLTLASPSSHSSLNVLPHSAHCCSNVGLVRSPPLSIKSTIS